MIRFLQKKKLERIAGNTAAHDTWSTGGIKDERASEQRGNSMMNTAGTRKNPQGVGQDVSDAGRAL